MIAAFVVVAVVGVAVGVWIGMSIAGSRVETFLDEVDGSPPRWSVDHLASQVAEVAARFEGRRAREAIQAIRATRVRFVPFRFRYESPEVEAPQGISVAVTWGGRVFVRDGDGWERRLAWALMQRVRIALDDRPGRHDERGALPPEFGAADLAAQEVADAVVRTSEGDDREVGVVVARPPGVGR